ncbi:hypothetical protein F5Y14DRAFT_398215 [Nemania sp. NC0429]|nr:hypothetical protein F5Y14DRAFT_398215 [Nemania sp. NC0429]
MSFPTTASTPSPVRDGHDLSFSSSQSSNNPDSSALCFESSFRLETPFPNQKAESEKHPKGKRKRTTSQDKTILEAAYNSNPKPDKAARLDIVKRVSLNEKEVQIWFQNRRQNDRRKSRPLSPQEIEALRYGNGMRILSSDPLLASIERGPTPIALPNAAQLPQSSSTGSTTPVETGGRSISPGDADSHHGSKTSSPRGIELREPETGMKRDLEAMKKPVSTPPSPTRIVGSIVGSDSEPHPYATASATPVGYLANRWFAGDSFSTSATQRSRGDSLRSEWDARPSIGSGMQATDSRLNSFSSSVSSTTDHPPPALKSHSSSSSQVRLSLSLDGKAELISAQPSPPRPTPQLGLNTEILPPVFGNRTLQRSRSALSGITLPPISTLTKNLGAPFPPRFNRGRSRDVHAWESCCEANTRDELTRQAEDEASGSAIAAISLMRSSSSSASLSNLIHNHHPNSQPPSHPGVLQPNLSKRNTLGMARSSLDRKPKFGRAKTSPPVTRYMPLDESTKIVDQDGDDDDLEPEKKRRKKQDPQFDILSPSGDSDKENWSPGKNGDPERRRLPPPPPETAASPTKTAVAPSTNPRRVGRILGEQDPTAKRLFANGSTDSRSRHTNRANTAPTLGQRSRKPGDAAVAIFEDGESTPHKEKEDAQPRAGKRDDEDVERFMRGELSPSKRPDMACVAGLLSLSQGNWR